MSKDYIVVPEDEDFDPKYVPNFEEDENVEEHPPIPEDLSDYS